MQKPNSHTNYITDVNARQVFFPFDVGLVIPADDSVILLNQVVEELNFNKLYKAYSRTGRKSAVSPKTLFKILVYGYMNRIYSSRGLEKACKRDINFIWLLEGKRAPDHNTIARFRTKRLDGILDELLTQFVMRLHEKKEIQFENVFIDGTKLEAYANKYSFVWKKATEKNELKLHSKIVAFLGKIFPQTVFQTVNLELLYNIRNLLFKQASLSNIVFVSGKGNKKTQLQQTVELLNQFIRKQIQYNEYYEIFKGRNSFSKTDKDATFMKMKDDHMRNSQLKPGYNIQIGVEAEYIIGVDVSSERSDVLTFIPFLENLKTIYSKKITNVIADAGYESEENYHYLFQNNQNAFIKPQNYERLKNKNYLKNNIGKVEALTYNDNDDTYICKNGRKLVPLHTKQRKSASGYIRDVQIYESKNCTKCELKKKCMVTAKKKKSIEVSKKFLAYRKKSLENITSEQGISLRINRSIQVEGAFGVLKEDYLFRRFLTRGKKNVKLEFLLLCFGYNVNKLHNKIQRNRRAEYLHPKKEAA